MTLYQHLATVAIPIASALCLDPQSIYHGLAQPLFG